jgi:hypothetical protein
VLYLIIILFAFRFGIQLESKVEQRNASEFKRMANTIKYPSFFANTLENSYGKYFLKFLTFP